MQVKSPFFSVIIPAYNREHSIERTISSVLDQEFSDYEIIVIDDASTDKTIEIVNGISDSRLKLLCNEVNSERCISRNRGAKHAKGEFLCFLDSDDTFLPYHLSTLYEEICKNDMEKAMYFANSYLILNNGEPKEKRVPPFEYENRYAYLMHYTPNPARVCLHNSILHKFSFDSNIPGLEDFELWLRIAKNYPVYHIEKFTSIYWLDENSYSNDFGVRYIQELQKFKYIFSKDEIKRELPNKSKRRLLSMCHFHMSQYFNDIGKKGLMYKSIISSFFLFPKGYNEKTNKILTVLFLYNLPFVGAFIKYLKSGS